MADTFKCPYHGEELPIVKQGKKLVAICNCDPMTTPNPWKDTVVFYQALEEKSTEPKKKAKPKKKVSK